MNDKIKRNWKYEADKWWKFVQVTELFWESHDSNTGKMLVNRLYHGLKGRFLELKLHFNVAGHHFVPLLGQINGMVKKALKGKLWVCLNKGNLQAASTVEESTL